MQDQNFTVTRALPAGAATVTSTVLDMKNPTAAQNGIAAVGDVELACEIPAAPLAQLANTETLTYTAEASNSATFASGVVPLGQFGVQTGATGTDPQPAQFGRVGIPSNCPRYVRLKIVKTGVTDASSLSAKFGLRF